ncbi:hypothetical protein ACFSTD_02255 [Novosphingobium colocasiae]
MNEISVLEQIADTAPSLRTAYDTEVSYWMPESPPGTTLAGALASALARHVAEIPADALSKIFATCETVMHHGSTYDAEVVATGFLEGLQHANDRGDFDFRQIAKYLGAKSHAHCVAMDEFHGSSSPGLI